MNILNFKNKLGTKVVAAVAAIMAIIPTTKAMISSVPTSAPSSDESSDYVRACNQALIRAVNKGSLEAVKFAVLNGPTTERGLALCIAVKNNRYDIVGFLLPRIKNNPDTVTDTLRIAEEHGVYGIVNLLLSPKPASEQGIDPLCLLIPPTL